MTNFAAAAAAAAAVAFVVARAADDAPRLEGLPEPPGGVAKTAAVPAVRPWETSIASTFEL